jgi:hypothetical protein
MALLCHPLGDQFEATFDDHLRFSCSEASRLANGFVPEGQADSSQARSAWGAVQRTSVVPEGWPKSLSDPETFVAETEFMILKF